MNNKTINWRKIITYGIATIFMFYIYAAMNFSAESAKQAASQYERRKHIAVLDMELQNYDDLVINNELIDYSMLRDSYNIKWYEETGQRDEIKGMTHGMGWGRTYSLFNWALLNGRVHPAFYDEKDPIFRENPKKRFPRIFVLRKIDGVWMIYKDIVDFENDISFWQLFDPDYLQNKIDMYNDFLEQIVTTTKEYDGELSLSPGNVEELDINGPDRFSGVEDLQLQGSAKIFFENETYVEDVLGAPEEVELEKEGYVRDPVGIFDLKTIRYPELQINFIRELLPTHFEDRTDHFRFKEVEVFKAGIKGPRGIEVGNTLEDVLSLFPVPYQDEDNMRQYGRVDLENGEISEIEFSDYVSDSPYGLFVHHFNFTVYFTDNKVERYHIKHIMYDL